MVCVVVLRRDVECVFGGFISKGSELSLGTNMS